MLILIFILIFIFILIPTLIPILIFIFNLIPILILSCCSILFLFSFSFLRQYVLSHLAMLNALAKKH